MGVTAVVRRQNVQELSHTHAHTHAYTHTVTSIHTHEHTHGHTSIHAHKHTPAHRHTSIHLCVCTHKHTHTHTPPQVQVGGETMGVTAVVRRQNVQELTVTRGNSPSLGAILLLYSCVTSFRKVCSPLRPRRISLHFTKHHRGLVIASFSGTKPRFGVGAGPWFPPVVRRQNVQELSVTRGAPYLTPQTFFFFITLKPRVESCNSL